MSLAVYSDAVTIRMREQGRGVVYNFVQLKQCGKRNHNPRVGGSSPSSATTFQALSSVRFERFTMICKLAAFVRASFSCYKVRAATVLQHRAALTSSERTERPMPDDALTLLPEPPQARFNRNRISDGDNCVVYFLAGAGLIKIGCTTNLTSRLRTIRNSSPVPVQLLATMRGGTVEEGFAHGWFSHLRRHGEWFEDEGAIRAKIIQFTNEPNRGVKIPADSPLRECLQ